MENIKYYFDKRSAKKDGTCPLKVYVNTVEGVFYVPTGIYLKANQWNAGMCIICNHPRQVPLNNYLANMLVRTEDKILNVQLKEKRGLHKQEIKDLVIEIYVGKAKEEKGEVETIFNQFINDISKSAWTRDIYNVTWNKIKVFSRNKASTLSFDDIDIKWLKAFNSWLISSRLSINARAIHFRNIRAVFNAAIDNELTTNYPFRRFKIQHEKTMKRNLTIEQLRELYNKPVKPFMKKYIDFFFLMFFLMGINGIDLLLAKKNQIVNGRLEYRRAKTGTLYSVKIEPEAMEIINRYRGKNYLLNFCDNRKSYRTFMLKANHYLKELIPGCTSYYARHSVASIAAKLDIPLDTIARMLGHTDPSKKVTLIYVDFDSKKVDDANRKVIDYFFSGLK